MTLPQRGREKQRKHRQDIGHYSHSHKALLNHKLKLMCESKHVTQNSPYLNLPLLAKLTVKPLKLLFKIVPSLFKKVKNF